MNILKVLTEKRKRGNLGEKSAVKHLRKAGYRIIKRNYVANNYEIDVIATKKDIMAFVEVKARNIKNLGYMEARPASALTPEKQLKIIKAATYYKGYNPSEHRMRFDVIEVYLEETKRGLKVKEIKHLEAAFDKNTALKRF